MTAPTRPNSRDQDSLRILMVSDFYPPVIGGLERYVQTLGHELAGRGHEVSVATMQQDDTPSLEIDGTVRVHRLRGWQRAFAPFYQSSNRQFHPTLPDPGIAAGLRRVIAEEQPDIVHAHSWMLYSMLPLKGWSGASIVMTLHDYGLACSKKTYLYNGTLCTGPALGKCVSCAGKHYGMIKGTALTTTLRASAYLHDRVDRYLAISSAVRAASLVRSGGRPIEVVPSFISDRAADDALTSERPDFLPPDDTYILFVGALGRHKGLDILLEAYEQLGREVPLVVLGTEQPDTPKRFPDGVIIVRNVPHHQVMGAWKRCLFGVVPSVWPEPLGLVAFEAMASGKPVIASSVGGLPDTVLDGETGFLVPPGNVAALRAAICSLLDDPQRREAMGRAGRIRSRHFTASVVTNRIEQIYRDVLVEGARAGSGERLAEGSTR